MKSANGNHTDRSVTHKQSRKPGVFCLTTLPNATITQHRRMTLSEWPIDRMKRRVWGRRFKSSGMLCHVDWCFVTPQSQSSGSGCLGLVDPEIQELNLQLRRFCEPQISHNRQVDYQFVIQDDSGGICNTVGNDSMCDSKHAGTHHCVTDDLQWTKPWIVDVWHIS
jgi:hypothetical protein